VVYDLDISKHFYFTGLVPHDVMTLSFHCDVCDVAVHVSCLDQWGHTDIPTPLKQQKF